MGVVVKQSFWGTLLTYLGVIVGYANTLYVRPEFLTLEQISLFTLVTANAMMISPLGTFGMGGAYVKYFPEFKDSKELKNQLFTFQFLAITFVCAVIILTGLIMEDWIVEQFAEGSSEYSKFLLVTGAVLIVNSYFEYLFAYSSTRLKVIFPSFLREVFLRVGAIALVLGYSFGLYSFTWAVNGLFINYGSVLVLHLINLILFHELKFDFSFSLLSKEWVKKIIRFATYAATLSVSFAVLNNSSYNQVTSFLGDKMNGIFVTCFFIGVIVEMPRRNMARVVSPLLSDALTNNNIKETENLYKRSSITMTVIGSLLFIGLVTNIQDLWLFIPKGDKFALGTNVVLAVCSAKLLVMLSSFGGEIINFSAHYKMNLIMQIGAAILLVTLNIYLIPRWGLTGVGISYFITILVHTIAKFLFVYSKFRITPFVKSHLYLLPIVVAVTIGASYFSLSMHPIATIIIRSILTTIVFVGLIYYFQISKDINSLINSTFERLLKLKQWK